VSSKGDVNGGKTGG